MISLRFWSEYDNHSPISRAVRKQPTQISLSSSRQILTHGDSIGCRFAASSVIGGRDRTLLSALLLRAFRGTDLNKFDVELERFVRTDQWRITAHTECQFRRQENLPVSAFAHQRQDFLPAFEHAVNMKDRRHTAREGAVELAPIDLGAAVVNRDGIGKAGTCALAFFDESVLNAAWQSDDAVLGLVFCQELVRAGLVFLGKPLELLHALLPDAFVESAQDLLHFRCRHLRFTPGVGVANGSDDRLDIDIPLAGFGSEFISNGITQLALIGLQILCRDRQCYCRQKQRVEKQLEHKTSG